MELLSKASLNNQVIFIYIYQLGSFKLKPRYLLYCYCNIKLQISLNYIIHKQ